MKHSDTAEIIFNNIGQAAFKTLGAWGRTSTSDTGLKMPVEGSTKCHAIEIERNKGRTESYRVVFYRNQFEGLVKEGGRARQRVVAEHDEVLPDDLNGVIANETGIPVYWN